MSVVRPRSHSSHSPPRGRVNVVGDDEEDGQFRRNGRRRLDSVPFSLQSTPGNFPPVSSPLKGLNGLSPGSPPKFAITPAEFNLFPSARPADNARKPQNDESESQGVCLGVGHLTTLRSAAFWELRRSVTENGEGLIRRMRDYELSRLHQQVRQKAKERRKRSHRFSTRRSGCKQPLNVSEPSDDDDVLICSDSTSKAFSSRWSSRFLDSMDVDGQDQDHLEIGGLRSMPVQHYYDEGTPFVGNPSLIEKTKADSEFLLSSPDSASPTPSSSSMSLPLPRSTTSSEKALSELNIAFANGACCITDYSPIWTYQQQFNTDENETGYGDLWR